MDFIKKVSTISNNSVTQSTLSQTHIELRPHEISKGRQNNHGDSSLLNVTS